MKLSNLISATVLATLSTVAQADPSATEFFTQDAARNNTTVAQQNQIARVAPGTDASVRRAPTLKRVVASTAISRPGRPSRGGGALASWYGGGEKLARHTASGEVFRPNGLTAAHRTLPLGTRLEVSANGRSVMVRVNDRGPAAWTGRSLDLSKGAARALGMIGSGAVRVSYRAV